VLLTQRFLARVLRRSREDPGRCLKVTAWRGRVEVENVATGKLRTLSEARWTQGALFYTVLTWVVLKGVLPLSSPTHLVCHGVSNLCGESSHGLRGHLLAEANW